MGYINSVLKKNKADQSVFRIFVCIMCCKNVCDPHNGYIKITGCS